MKLGIIEGRPELLGRFPDGIVDEHATPADAPVELGGDESGLFLEIRRIRLPSTAQLVNLLWVYREFVNENDRTAPLLHLVIQGDVFVHFNELQHGSMLRSAA